MGNTRHRKSDPIKGEPHNVWQRAARYLPTASLHWRRLAIALGSAALLHGAVSISQAQEVSATIRVLPGSAGRVLIEGNCAPATVWSFRDSYAGVMNLGGRIEALALFDAAGAEIPRRKIAPGQFVASRPASKFRYEVSLAPPASAAQSALVSWLNTERGVLMLSDLLPVVQPSNPTGQPSEAVRKEIKAANADSRATVRFSVPEGWAVHSNEVQNEHGEFQVPDVGRSVFAVGRHLRASQTAVGKTRLNIIVDGEWAFADSDAKEMATNVLKLDLDAFGSEPSNRATLILFPFPQTTAADRWSAETRGANVTLLMGKLPSKTGALALLSVPLTHELFHLWVPNGLGLDGDYDWFYEGFTVYQAARAGVRLDLLTFQEFLNAVARAYDAYSASTDRDRWSLIEASRLRWTTGSTVVYQKSMLVALLCDLKMRSQSRSKRSLDDLYREIFRRHHVVQLASSEGRPGTDGNAAVLAVLDGNADIRDFAMRFVRQPATIDLLVELAPFGLQVERVGLRTRITIAESLTDRQRDLLRKLGYNDSVRSSTPRKR